MSWRAWLPSSKRLRNACPLWLREAQVRSALEDAAHRSGLAADDGARSVIETINSVFAAGIGKPRDLSEIGNKARRAAERRGAGAGDASTAPRASDEGLSASDITLRRIGLEYPLTPLAAPLICYEMHRGRVWLHKEIQPKKGEPFLAPIATPFSVTARLRYADREGAYGLRVSLQDMACKPRYVDVDCADLARQGGAPIRERLFREGFKTEDDGEHIAVRCLKAAAPAIEITIVSQPGWHED
ncbi:MAG: hypothetical protein PGN25_15040 [Methylorubrum populi]